MSKAEERYLECFQDGRVRNCSSKEAFLLGYNQAEKDLDIISWVKKVSGVKEMKRAKEEALKAYPPRSIAANYAIIDKRDAFEYGYLKAEKDLELTVDDIKIIDRLLSQCIDYSHPYQEVLKRFKDLKK